MQTPSVEFQKFTFFPVIFLPPVYDVFDFTKGYDEKRMRECDYGIGKYDEKRPGMYTTELFGGFRDVHMGIDIAAPVGEPVHAFWKGQILFLAYNPDPGDYGYTIVTEHELDGHKLYALLGHLSARSVEGKRPGQVFEQGEVLAWVGDRHENGGWNPHLHFQLSWQKPDRADLPGVVSDHDREQAKLIYPDPRLVLGPLY